MTVRILTNARLVLTDRVIDDGWLAIRDGVIDGLAAGEPPEPARFPGDLVDYVDVERHWVLPGYIDLHCHGGGGRALYTGDIEDVRVAAAAHLDRGTTSLLASIASARLETMTAAAESIGAAIDDGSAPNIRGIHFEGPFLSPKRRGAQTGSALCLPDEGVFRALLRAAGGHAASMTIAPELAGALDLIRRHRDDIVFCVGHTDAGAEKFQAAVDAGARHVTHLFNAMPGLTHRSPGLVGRALLDPRVTVELIADGHHLAPDTVRLALATAGTGRGVLVTDAMAAAGVADGRYDFVDRSVDVRGGAGRRAGGAVPGGHRPAHLRQRGAGAGLGRPRRAGARRRGGPGGQPRRHAPRGGVDRRPLAPRRELPRHPARPRRLTRSPGVRAD
jgi:N-acetylglucosamine-6-phosphate deacetylase